MCILIYKNKQVIIAIIALWFFRYSRLQLARNFYNLSPEDDERGIRHQKQHIDAYLKLIFIQINTVKWNWVLISLEMVTVKQFFS